MGLDGPRHGDKCIDEGGDASGDGDGDGYSDGDGESHPTYIRDIPVTRHRGRAGRH